MPAHSIEFKNAVLDGFLGSTRAAGSPSAWLIELWMDRPDSVGASEADFGGYEAVTWDSDDWDAADGGEKSTSSLVDFGTPTADGSDAVRYWALRHTVSGTLAFSAPLERPLFVSEGGSPVLIRPTIKFA